MPLVPVFDPRQQIADRLIRPLREGKAELGWSGDPFLSLAFHRIENRWELWRLEPQSGNPDNHTLVARGPIGQDINESTVNQLIRRLVEMDTHRDGNSAEQMVENAIRHNDHRDTQQINDGADATADALAKFYYEAGKTLGVTQTDFYF
jgi:hypothetical protein|tara:strand:- start:993 stop:1439 length:447 start_codon:yes stop_codon:yes gene_type:complete